MRLSEAAWYRRVAEPIKRQLTQGITPEKVALSIALGFVLGIIPILQITTVLCAFVAHKLRLNQPIIQVVNYAVYPIQLGALIPFFRAGETLFRQPHAPISTALLVARFKAGPWAFVGDFGQIMLQGFVAWCLIAPVIAALLYYTLRPALSALARRRAARARRAKA